MSNPAPSAGTPPGKTPNRHKLVFLTWVGIYPTITLVLTVLLPPLMAHFPLPVVTLVITAIVVPLMSYVVMPLLLRCCRGWVSR